ncbi:MAG: ABC-2 family transporter protein [Actinomycetota bacterium]|nr:ABC-2 family transporter protein [Actinomycetota bacterium]
MAERSGLEAYRRLLGGAVRSQLAYPASFGLQLVGQALAQGVDLLAILVLFGRVAAMGGFSRDEVLLIYGLASVGFGLADLAVGQLDRLPDLIRSGQLDAMLLRPLSVLGQLCAADLALRRLGRVVAGAVTLGYALLAVEITWTPARVALVIVSPLTAAVILGAIWVAAASVCFWVVDGRELASSVTYGSNVFTSYPITIFSDWVRRLLAFIVPGAFVAYYPVLGLLGKPDPLGLPAVLRWCAPLVAMAAVTAATLVWRTGLRRYVGTGS